MLFSRGEGDAKGGQRRDKQLLELPPTARSIHNVLAAYDLPRPTKTVKWTFS